MEALIAVFAASFIAATLFPLPSEVALLASVFIVAACGLWVFVTHSLTAEHPLFDPALARDRNFVSSMIFGFFFSFVLFCSLTLLPLMMQGVLGYSVMHSGIISMPRGLVMLALLQVMGRVDSMVDRRLLVAIGLAFLVVSFWQMSLFDLSMTGGQIVWATVVQGIGQGIIFVPLSTLAFATLAPHFRNEGAAMFTLIRNLGSSIGISAFQVLSYRNAQTVESRLVEGLRPDNPVRASWNS